MDNVITYLNTDLDLVSTQDLSALAEWLTSRDVRSMHVTPSDGLYYAMFETSCGYTEPEPNIAAMLTVIESLPAELRAVWDGCTRREFNVGYDCGAEPWSFNHGLSAALLGRMAAVGTAFRVTLYPDKNSSADSQT